MLMMGLNDWSMCTNDAAALQRQMDVFEMRLSKGANAALCTPA
jgi:hypothetical protein